MLSSQDFVMSQIHTGDMPPELVNLPKLARLDSLIIKNFKSFKQETFTGPFLSFTSIVGPNGSGKSNVLDALMFCLCGQNLKHNFFDIREYINREKAESYKEMSKNKKVCSVTANFTLQDGKQLSVQRQLDPESNQFYFIDREKVSKKIYQNFLFRQGINPHIPNYAITQGEIDKLLMKQPLQLTKYMENLSGSILYKKQYDATSQQIAEIKKNVIDMNVKILKLRNDKKNAKDLGQASKQCRELEKQYEETINRLFLAKVFIKEIELTEMEELIGNKKNEQKQRIEEINKKKLKIQEELRQKQELNKEINTIERRTLELNAQLNTFKRPDLAVKQKQLEAQEKEMEYMQSELQKMVQKRQKLEKQIPEIHSSQIVRQYLRLYSQWQKKNEQIKLELQNKRSFFLNLQTQRQFQKSLLQSEQQKQKNVKQEEQKRKRDIESGKEQISQINEVIENLKKNIKEKQQMLKRNENSLRDQKQMYEKVENEIQNLEEILTENVENTKDKQIVKRLSLVDGFRGLIEQKIRVRNQKNIVAFSILTSSISKYLLCADQKSSKQISDKLKNMNTIKMLIILSNVKKPSSNESIKQNVGKLGIPAFEIIDFDSNVQGLNHYLEDYCRGKVICSTLATAFEIRNKNIPGLKEIITLDGEVIRNDGTITSCGNSEHIKRTLKIGSNMKSVEAQLQKATKTRDQLRLKITQLQKQVNPEQQMKRNEQIIKLERKKVQIQQKIQFLSSIKPRQTKSFKVIERDIDMISEKLDKVQKQIKQIEKGISKDKIMADFMKKHNISNIDSFRSASNLEVQEKQTKLKNQIKKQIDQITAKIDTIKAKIDNRAARINHIRSNLNFVTGKQNQRDIERQLEQNQAKIRVLREKISKLGVYKETDLLLKSQIAQMEAKYKNLKEKFNEYVDDLRNEMGVPINKPRTKDEWKPLQTYISQGPLFDLDRRRIENALRDLQQEKRICQTKLQKFNSINLISRNHQNDETEIATELKSLNQSVTQNNTRRTELENKLGVIRTDRKATFLRFFDQVKHVLNQTYAALTETQPGIAGKADFFLENSDLPFEHGIYYTPTPPVKRFIYDLDQLSGGQKSIGSLALQYALAVCSKSPFLILDESDAYLDSINTNKLLRLIEKSSQEKRIQIILITHKSTVFSNCESLVGICRPKQQFSKVFAYKIK